MRYLSYIVVLFLVCVNCTSQQKALESPVNIETPQRTLNFPDEVLGSYKGDLTIQNKNKDEKSTVGMEFHLQAADNLGTYIYQIVYIIDGNRQERNYKLITKDADKGEYVIDENNGIILSATAFENRLYSVFEVQGNLLFTIEEFYDDYMVFQIVFSSKKDAAKTGTETIPVTAFPVTVNQLAILKKQ